MDIAETKKNLWKLRRKENLYEKKNKEVEQLEKSNSLEEKLEKIKDILNQIRKEEEIRNNEKKEYQEKQLKEWRKKVREKEKKEHERKERLKRQEILGKRWGMLRWITNYINENQEDWELARILQEEEARLELEEFKKMKRLEKVEHLRKKWVKEENEKERVIEERKSPAEDTCTKDQVQSHLSETKIISTTMTSLREDVHKKMGGGSPHGGRSFP